MLFIQNSYGWIPDALKRLRQDFGAQSASCTTTRSSIVMTSAGLVLSILWSTGGPGHDLRIGRIMSIGSSAQSICSQGLFHPTSKRLVRAIGDRYFATSIHVAQSCSLMTLLTLRLAMRSIKSSASQRCMPRTVNGRQHSLSTSKCLSVGNAFLVRVTQPH